MKSHSDSPYHHPPRRYAKPIPYHTGSKQHNLKMDSLNRQIYYHNYNIIDDFARNPLSIPLVCFIFVVLTIILVSFMWFCPPEKPLPPKSDSRTFRGKRKKSKEMSSASIRSSSVSTSDVAVKESIMAIRPRLSTYRLPNTSSTKLDDAKILTSNMESSSDVSMIDSNVDSKSTSSLGSSLMNVSSFGNRFKTFKTKIDVKQAKKLTRQRRPSVVFFNRSRQNIRSASNLKSRLISKRKENQSKIKQQTLPKSRNVSIAAKKKPPRESKKKK